MPMPMNLGIDELFYKLKRPWYWPELTYKICKSVCKQARNRGRR